MNGTQQPTSTIIVLCDKLTIVIAWGGFRRLQWRSDAVKDSTGPPKQIFRF